MSPLPVRMSIPPISPLDPCKSLFFWCPLRFLLFNLVLLSISCSEAQHTNSPYPPSEIIKGITWHWDTYKTAAPGSDLWPVTWAADDNIYSAWGDGGGFGGTDKDGRAALGFARIEGSPEQFVGRNVNGGKDSQHPASFPKLGKVGSILAIGNTLYAWLNMQNGKWPDVDRALIWSDDRAATWQQSNWVFPKGAGNFKPGTFVNFGRGYTGLPPEVPGYVYFYGQRQGLKGEVYLGRVAADQLTNRQVYEFLSGFEKEKPLWDGNPAQAKAVFADSRLVGDLPTVVYVPGLKLYLLSIFHTGPGQLGIFDAPTPWGPWTTVAYYENWGRMGVEDQGLTCSFPAKWMSADGMTLWCVFAVYGEGAKKGINAHDKFNLVKVTLDLK
jgi:hypothetical protein